MEVRSCGCGVESDVFMCVRAFACVCVLERVGAVNPVLT